MTTPAPSSLLRSPPGMRRSVTPTQNRGKTKQEFSPIITLSPRHNASRSLLTSPPRRPLDKTGMATTEPQTPPVKHASLNSIISPRVATNNSPSRTSPARSRPSNNTRRSTSAPRYRTKPPVGFPARSASYFVPTQEEEEYEQMMGGVIECEPSPRIETINLTLDSNGNFHKTEAHSLDVEEEDQGPPVPVVTYDLYNPFTSSITKRNLIKGLISATGTGCTNVLVLPLEDVRKSELNDQMMQMKNREFANGPRNTKKPSVITMWVTRGNNSTTNFTSLYRITTASCVLELKKDLIPKQGNAKKANVNKATRQVRVVVAWCNNGPASTRLVCHISTSSHPAVGFKTITDNWTITPALHQCGGAQQESTVIEQSLVFPDTKLERYINLHFQMFQEGPGAKKAIKITKVGIEMETYHKGILDSEAVKSIAYGPAPIEFDTAPPIPVVAPESPRRSVVAPVTPPRLYSWDSSHIHSLNDTNNANMSTIIPTVNEPFTSPDASNEPFVQAQGYASSMPNSPRTSVSGGATSLDASPKASSPRSPKSPTSVAASATDSKTTTTTLDENSDSTKSVSASLLELLQAKKSIADKLKEREEIVERVLQRAQEEEERLRQKEEEEREAQRQREQAELVLEQPPEPSEAEKEQIRLEQQRREEQERLLQQQELEQAQLRREYEALPNHDKYRMDIVMNQVKTGFSGDLARIQDVYSRGLSFIKHDFHSKKKLSQAAALKNQRTVKIDAKNEYLIVSKNRFSTRKIALKDIKWIVYGSNTSTLRRSGLVPWRCFSLAYGDRTLDLESLNDRDIETLIVILTSLIYPNIMAHERPLYTRSSLRFKRLNLKLREKNINWSTLVYQAAKAYIEDAKNKLVVFEADNSNNNNNKNENENDDSLGSAATAASVEHRSTAAGMPQEQQLTSSPSTPLIQRQQHPEQQLVIEVPSLAPPSARQSPQDHPPAHEQHIEETEPQQQNEQQQQQQPVHEDEQEQKTEENNAPQLEVVSSEEQQQQQQNPAEDPHQDQKEQPTIVSTMMPTDVDASVVQQQQNQDEQQQQEATQNVTELQQEPQAVPPPSPPKEQLQLQQQQAEQVELQPQLGQHQQAEETVQQPPSPRQLQQPVEEVVVSEEEHQPQPNEPTVAISVTPPPATIETEVVSASTVHSTCSLEVAPPSPPSPPPVTYIPTNLQQQQQQQYQDPEADQLPPFMLAQQHLLRQLHLQRQNLVLPLEAMLLEHSCTISDNNDSNNTVLEDIFGVGVDDDEIELLQHHDEELLQQQQEERQREQVRHEEQQIEVQNAQATSPRSVSPDDSF